MIRVCSRASRCRAVFVVAAALVVGACQTPQEPVVLDTSTKILKGAQALDLARTPSVVTPPTPVVAPSKPAAVVAEAAPRPPPPARVAAKVVPKTPSRRLPPGPPPKLHVTDRDPIHDRASPAYALLQRPSQALRGFPLDRRGRVDWVKALAQQRIAPRSTLRGHKAMQVLESDILMTNTRSMPHVRFPHAAHTQWLSCNNCHPRPFPKQAGASPITMDAIFRGKYCGMCHDKVAFSTFVCERCHNAPHDGSPQQWW